MGFIDFLIEVLPPPKNPSYIPRDEEIQAVEGTFNVKFQEDFKRFMKVYGEGMIYDTFEIYNVGNPEYIATIENSRNIYAFQRGLQPSYYHLELWPHSPGIFPMGRTADGNQLYWMVREGGDINGFAVFEPKSPSYLYFGELLSIFLRLCISKDLPYIHGDFLSSAVGFHSLDPGSQQE